MDNITFYKLRSYGFLHPGREDWKRFTKRCFPVVPGSTMYGAVAHALMKMGCRQYHEDEKKCDVDCTYSILLEAVKSNSIRFSPLVWSKSEVRNLGEYNSAALNVLVKKSEMRAITPHTSVDRDSAIARESQLFMNYTHPPFMDYYGFIVHNNDETLLNSIKKAVRYFPCLPFGGAGKFCTTEVTILGEMNRDEAIESMSNVISNKVRFLTPAIIDSETNLFGTDKIKSSNLKFKLYKFWRRGLYWDAFYENNNDESQNDIDKKGTFIGDIDNNYSSKPVLGVTENSSIEFKDSIDLKEKFINGYCHKSWKYLGWGQIVFEER